MKEEEKEIASEFIALDSVLSGYLAIAIIVSYFHVQYLMENQRDALI